LNYQAGGAGDYPPLPIVIPGTIKDLLVPPPLKVGEALTTSYIIKITNI